MIILIADSGSTKTDWRLVLPDGTVKIFKTDGLNPYFQTEAQIAGYIAQYLLPEILPTAHPGEIYFYGAGCANEEQCNVVKMALQQCFPNMNTIEVSSDMLGAARALCGNAQGLVAILGTGANACYYDGSGIMTKTPSLGFILGDEGSGAYLGKVLVKSFLYNEMPEAIHKAFHAEYAITKDIVVDAVYRKPFPNRYLASFVPFISRYIEHGYMQNLVYAAFEIFLDHHICKYAEYKNTPFSATGAIAWHFKAILQKAATNKEIRIGTILESPVDGLVKYHKKKHTF